MPANPCEWKVGRRVRLRGTDNKGVIDWVFLKVESKEVSVKWDRADFLDTDHLFEELKLLKPRTPKPASRAVEYWIGFPYDASKDPVVYFTDVTSAQAGWKQIVHVREVIPSEVCLSRETLCCKCRENLNAKV